MPPATQPVGGIVEAIYAAFGANGDAAMRVAMCESGLNPNATGAAGERGIFQIHPLHRDSTYDIAGNIAAAYRISAGGSDWSQWTCKP